MLSSVFSCAIFDPATDTDGGPSLGEFPSCETESLIPLDFTLGDRELIAPSPSLFNLSFEDDLDRDFRDRNNSEKKNYIFEWKISENNLLYLFVLFFARM